MIDNRLKNAKLKRANSIKIALLIIILLTVFVIIVLLTSQKKLKKLNQKVLSQNKIIKDQNEELMHYQSILEMEISERTDQLEMALIKSLESDRLKKEFIENLSHEIRTPMNAILGFSEILEIENKVDNKYTEIIRNNMELLLELMDNLLELSKHKAGAYDLKIESFVLKDIFEDFKKYAYQKRKFEKKEHIKLSFKLLNDAKSKKIKTDRHKLMSILQELVNNAIKYTETGSVSVVFSYYENKLSVLIQDTGIGIKKEKIPYIFDAFSKINVANNKYRGTGIGLAFVKNIIDALNGNITVESEVGKGSIFRLVVPGM
jgi:signal transduction histidine kinase